MWPKGIFTPLIVEFGSRIGDLIDELGIDIGRADGFEKSPLLNIGFELAGVVVFLDRDLFQLFLLDRSHEFAERNFLHGIDK